MSVETLPNPTAFAKQSCQTPVLTVFCDFDGPLVDVSDRYYNTYQLALHETYHYYARFEPLLTINPLSKEEFWQMKQERTNDQEIALRSGLKVQQIPYFIEQVRSIVNNTSLLTKDKFHPGVNWGLALLHSQGVRLVVVTLRCQEQVTQILINYGLLRLFSGVYGTTDAMAAYRNNIECKTALLKQAHADHPSDRACMIGDTEADVLAAKAIGICPIALTCGIRSYHYLQQFDPDQIRNNFLTTAYGLLADQGR
jgi:phosphoglycolate phosphatase-like HAD superfamily hydrolase